MTELEKLLDKIYCHADAQGIAQRKSYRRLRIRTSALPNLSPKPITATR